MNLYEVKDLSTGRILIHASPAGEVAKLLKCSPSKVKQSHYANYAIDHKYKVECVDIALKKNDSIWIEWELHRCWLLKLCGR